MHAGGGGAGAASAAGGAGVLLEVFLYKSLEPIHLRFFNG